MENLAFHSLTEMKDDYTTNSHYCILIRFSLKGWANVLFKLKSERVTSEQATSDCLFLVCGNQDFSATGKLELKQIKTLKKVARTSRHQS